MLKISLANSARMSRSIGVVAALAMFLTACGFHLRGNIPLSDGIKNMYVQAPEGSFKEQLEEVLAKAGAQLATAAKGADVVLNVTQATSDRTVGTLDERGKANSYNLTFKVTYTLDDPHGNPIRKTTKVVETRRYAFEPELVIESESEEAELLESMEQDASLRIVRQLSTITDYEPK